MRVFELFEGKRDKALSYEEIPVKAKKGQAPSKEIDKVIVKLQAAESAKFTILAKNYKELQIEVKALNVKLEEKKEALRENMAELFDDADEASTRIVETCSLTLQLAKAVQPGEKTEVDYEKAYNSLLESLASMVPELTEQVKALSECAVKGATFTTTTPAKKSAFTVKEGVLDNVISFFKNVHKKFMSWLGRYDKKLAKAKAQLEVLQAK